MACFQNTGHVIIAVLFATISFTSPYPALVADFKLIGSDGKGTSELDLSRQKRTFEAESLSRQKRVDLGGDGGDGVVSQNDGSVNENLEQLSRQKRTDDDDGNQSDLSRQKRLDFAGESTLSRQKRIDAGDEASVSRKKRLTADEELQLSRQKRLEDPLAESTREDGLSRQKRLQV